MWYIILVAVPLYNSIKIDNHRFVSGIIIIDVEPDAGY
jgi:hypothetical protein